MAIRWQLPVTFPPGRVTSPFGWRPNPLYPISSSLARTWHNGVDIGTGRLGDQVVAAARGRVIAEGFLREPWSMAAPAGSGWVGGNYGGVMVVQDVGEGYVIVSAHLERNIVNVGDMLDAGDVLGYIGATGSAGAPGAGGHLHTTVLHNGSEVDPMPLFTSPPPVITETREQRLARTAVAYRQQLPRFVAMLEAATGRIGPIHQDSRDEPLGREDALAIEVVCERLAAALGDDLAAVIGITMELQT